MKFRKILSVTLVLFMTTQVMAQRFDETEVVSAAGDELTRNMQGLALPGYPKPFFISFSIGSLQHTQISASMGSIVSVSTSPMSNSASVRLLVGDYNKTSEVIYGQPSTSTSLPMNASVDAVKRTFWSLADVSYREALNMYGRKMSFLDANPRSGKYKNLIDFEETKAVSSVIDTPEKEAINVELWKAKMRQLSAVFNNYKAIESSSVQFEDFSYIAYRLTSEGTLIKTPHTLTNITVNAAMTMDNGSIVNDAMKISVATASDLPSMDSLTNTIKGFLDNFIAYSKAELLDDKYRGPVMFDNSTYSLYLNGMLLSPGALIAMRPQEGQQIGETMAEKVGDVIIDKRLTVKNYTSLAEYNGTKLMGSYTVDAEGVTPAAEITLIENGEVKSVLNGRTPTVGAEKSTGSSRWVIGATPMSVVAPGTIHYIFDETTKSSQMKKQLMKLAKKKKKKFAYIVRRVSTGAALVYRVDTSSGDETLVRGVQLPNLDIETFENDILAISNEEKVMNMLSPSNTLMSVILPTSIIVDNVTLDKTPQQQPRTIYLKAPSKR